MSSPVSKHSIAQGKKVQFLPGIKGLRKQLTVPFGTVTATQRIAFM